MNKVYCILLLLAISTSGAFSQESVRLKYITPEDIERFFSTRKEFLRFCLENGYTNVTNKKLASASNIDSFTLKKSNPSANELSNYINISRQSAKVPDTEEYFIRIKISMDKHTLGPYIDHFEGHLKEYFNKVEVKENDDDTGAAGYSVWLEYTKEGSEITATINNQFENTIDYTFVAVSSKFTD